MTGAGTTAGASVAWLDMGQAPSPRPSNKEHVSFLLVDVVLGGVQTLQPGQVGFTYGAPVQADRRRGLRAFARAVPAAWGSPGYHLEGM